jgi:peptide/nickel transport system ATP-binding protein
MIAIALIFNPALVVIADEPTTALDVTVQAQIVSLLRSLVERRNISVLYITHDLAVASRIADRIVVMYAGQEMESAPTSSFFPSPSHPHTKKLLVCLSNPEGRIQNIPGRIPTLIRGPPKGCRFHDRCDLAKAICSQDKPP